jgi:hypothetical protein
VTQLLLCLFALGDVTLIDHDAFDSRIIQKIPGYNFECAPRAVFVQNANVKLYGGAWTLEQF